MEFKKKNPKIYILSGKAESGKNEIAKIITEFYEQKSKKIITISYASYLKQYAKEIIKWDGNEKNKPREFLQQIGVELIKNNIKGNLLIERIIDDVKVYSYFFDIIIISDARFKEEIEEIKKLSNNVVVMNIHRKNNSLTKQQQNHITETALDNYNKYDYKIENEDSKETLKRKIFNILEVI